MHTDRRRILKAAGGLTVVVVGGGVWRSIGNGVFASGTGPAFAPWTDWQAGMNEGPLALVRAAILAASPHNSQPWRFRVWPSRIELYADPGRALGAPDPFLREMHLALGCALENMLLAARVCGYEVDLELASGRLDGSVPGPEPVATMRLSRGPVSPAPLAAAIGERHTNRGPYDMGRPLSPETLSAIDVLMSGIEGVRVVLFADPGQRAAFATEVANAAEAVSADAAMVAAQEAWFRGDWSLVQSRRDGLAPDTAGMPAIDVTAAKLLPAGSPLSRHRDGLRRLREQQLPASPVFGLIAVPDLYDVRQALHAGRAWQRLHLWASTREIALQPLNVLLERVDRDQMQGREPEAARRLAGFIGDPAWRPTFAFRAGYPLGPAPPSPRRPVEWVLIEA